MKSILSVALLFGTLALATGQTNQILYQEDWGAAYASIGGNTAATTLAQVGWTPVGGQYTGMYAASAGSFDIITGVTVSNRPCYFSSAIASDAGIIYTTNGAGTGPQGTSAFTSIDPSANVGLTLNVSSQVSAGAGTVTNYFAVLVGGKWYVSARAFTNNSVTAGPTFSLNTLLYNPVKTNWNTLTQISTAPITVGGPPAADLTGTIDGVGIVQIWAATLPGTPGFNYVNFTITKPPTIPPDPSAPVINGTGFSQTTYAGGAASFAVNATVGTLPLTYKWSKDGGAPLVNGPTGTGSTILGATTSQIIISNVSSADAGAYSVVVSNATGSDNSANYVANTLTVLPTGLEIIYAETFPFVGPFTTALPLSSVGWQAPISAARVPNRVDVRGDVYAYENAGRTTGFFTSTNQDTGASGLAFPSNGITPANYPFVSFRATYSAPLNPGNASVYFAVQMAGGAWFVSTAANQLAANAGAFNTYGLQFNPTASGWNQLTINFNNSTTTIGSAATSDLNGKITGVGLVFAYTGPSLYLINNVSLVTNSTPPVAPSFPSLPNIPYSQTVYAGGGATFTFTEAGTLPFTNHWDFNQSGVFLSDGTTPNGSIISGSGTTALTIQNASSADQGVYRGIVSNPGGTSMTDTGTFGPVPLTVLAPPLGLIYTESFPVYSAVAGNQPLGIVGWTNQSSTSFVLFKAGAATVGTLAGFAFAGTPTNLLYYASTESDRGVSGLPFIAFNPANYPNGSLTFSAGLYANANLQYSNVMASFAIRLGGKWYVNATPVIPTGGVVPLTTASTLYSQTMNFAAGQWYNVTLTGSAGVTIGSLTTQPLSGTISAAGLMFGFIGTGGTINFNSFAIQAVGNSGANLIGGPNMTSGTNGTAVLTWIGNPAVKLQSSPSLKPTNWQDVPNTLGNHTLTVNAQGSPIYYRLTGPAQP